MIETVLLWLFAGTALAAAAAMLVLRHPMRVALALTGSMLSLAGVYALLGVHVIAVFQVLIYVGAIMVFMVYAIMLLDVRDRNVLVMLMCMELMLNGVNLSLVAFAQQAASTVGAVLVFLIFVVAAAEIAIAIPIVVLLVRRKDALDLNAYADLKG